MANPDRILIPTATLLGLLLSVGCDDGTTGPAATPRIGIYSGDRQVAPAGATLTSPLVVQVLDGEGRPARGVRIAWSVEEAGGYVSTPTSPSVTNWAGRALVDRTLGPDAGIHGTTASVDGPDSVSVRFTSVAQVQGAIRMMESPADNGNGQRDTVLSTLAPYRVLVLDHDDRPVPGVTVEWYASNGSLSTSTSLTDSSGVAEAVHTLGPNAVTQRVYAKVPGLIDSPVRFEATAEPGDPTRIVVADGSDQVGVVGEPVDPYVVRVLDAHDNPVDGATVTWAVAEGGGSIDPASSTTETQDPLNGSFAAAVHTLGPGEGVHRVTATAQDAAGEPAATFEATAVTGLVQVPSPSCYYFPYCGVTADFEPAEIEVPVGATVAWEWGGCWGLTTCPDHNVTFEDDPGEPTSSDTRNTGWHTRTFDEAGEYRYRCTVHSPSFINGEVGVVRVE